jgi:hypothetical protein
MKKTIFSASEEAEYMREMWVNQRHEELYIKCKEYSADFVFVCPRDLKAKIAAVSFMKLEFFKSGISNWPIKFKDEIINYIASNIGNQNVMVVIIKEDGSFSFYNLINKQDEAERA